MGGYLLIRDFRQRINKRGAPYGWPISVYTTPEALWGYDHISSAYSVDPAESKTMIYEQVRKNFRRPARRNWTPCWDGPDNGTAIVRYY